MKIELDFLYVSRLQAYFNGREAGLRDGDLLMRGFFNPVPARPSCSRVQAVTCRSIASARRRLAADFRAIRQSGLNGISLCLTSP